MEAIEAVESWLKTHLDIGADEEIEYHSDPEGSLNLRFHRHMFGISLYAEDSKITVILPDSIAHYIQLKADKFDLCHPDSLQKITAFVEKALKAFYCNHFFDDPNITWAERNVIVDAFRERLPDVWADALLAIKSGESPEDVIEEMEDGHILSLLRKLNYAGVREFVDNFRTFAVLGEKTTASSDGCQR